MPVNRWGGWGGGDPIRVPRGFEAVSNTIAGTLRYRLAFTLCAGVAGASQVFDGLVHTSGRVGDGQVCMAWVAMSVRVLWVAPSLACWDMPWITAAK